jgi:hypothetical protein
MLENPLDFLNIYLNEKDKFMEIKIIIPYLDSIEL